MYVIRVLLYFSVSSSCETHSTITDTVSISQSTPSVSASSITLQRTPTTLGNQSTSDETTINPTTSSVQDIRQPL